MSNIVRLTTARKESISQTQPQRHSVLRSAAENLSLRNVDQSICELFNEALARLVQLLYEQDAGGLCNVDGVTGKVLIPLPWGRNGYRRWGLRQQEANVLRAILCEWEHKPLPTTPSLFHYDRSRRSWHINLCDYSNYHIAKRWLAAYPVTISLYREMRI